MLLYNILSISIIIIMLFADNLEEIGEVLQKSWHTWLLL